MEETRSGARRQVSTVLDEEDIIELERIARQRRASVAQVIREMVAEGIERTRKSESLAAAV